MALEKMVLDEFIELLGSDAPAPGGGAAAALTGAIGIALSEMVCSLTLGNKKFEETREKIADYKLKANEFAKDFLAGMDKDAEAYRQVNNAYKLPRETDEQKAERKAEIQRTLSIGATPPLELMELGVKTLELTAELIGQTTKSAISDLGVSAVNIDAAVKGAYLNVLINTGFMDDKELAESFNSKAKICFEKSGELASEIYERVKAEL